MSVVLHKEFCELLESDVKSAIEFASDFAEKNGFNIYLIGGIVRDMIMAKNIIHIQA